MSDETTVAALPAIEIDLTELEWGDIERLDAISQDPEQANSLTVPELLGLMRRLCPNGYKRLQVKRDTVRFFEALGKALAEGGDPNS